VSVHQFRTATVTIEDGIIRAVFSDGRINELNTHWVDKPDVHAAAQEMGYDDNWQRYITEHELTHHWLADRMGWKYSYSLYEDPREEWPQHVAWEEHLVNSIQKRYHADKPDPYGVPESIWGDSYPLVIEDWKRNCLMTSF
jgi:hypothetical protein